MQPLIIYYTKTNNTTSVAQTLANTISAELVNIEQLPQADYQTTLSDRPLIGLGTGIYNTRPSKHILKLFALLPPQSKVFVFFTSGFTNDFLIKLYKSRFLKVANKHNIELLGIWNSPGHDKYPLLKWANIHVDRPNENDLQSAKAFAKSMLNL